MSMIKLIGTQKVKKSRHHRIAYTAWFA